MPFPGIRSLIYLILFRAADIKGTSKNIMQTEEGFLKKKNYGNTVRAVSQSSRLRFYHFVPSSKALMTFSGTRSKYRRQSSTNPSPRSGNRSRTWETSESSSTPEISGTLFGFLEGSD